MHLVPCDPSVLHSVLIQPDLSADRVFGHALNTVNKIRTGSQKPPVSERLRLYGLYKQAMEGDVGYVQTRPESASDGARREQDKWDAWHANSGLSRTAAKKAYIETLIATMHAYASAAPEARELVAELEFVWDQVKSNSNPSGSDTSSPLQVHGSYPGIASVVAAGDELGRQPPMRVLSPVSQANEEDAENEGEEFVDAPAYSQYEGEDEEQAASGAQERYDDAVLDRSTADSRPHPTSPGDVKWRKRIEYALVKMTNEVAALREQLESRSYVEQRRRHSPLGWILRLSWFTIKIVAVDVFALWVVILWLRRKKDRRLEGAIRVLLGDAVAQMQKVGSNMKVPKLPSMKS